jgi:hypothetical protein
MDYDIVYRVKDKKDKNENLDRLEQADEPRRIESRTRRTTITRATVQSRLIESLYVSSNFINRISIYVACESTHE